MKVQYEFETLAVHQEPDPATGALVPPIHPSTTFAQAEPGVHKGFEYSRTDNPTRRMLEERLALLEGGRFGVCFASGMAAISAVLGLLRPGDHVIACADLYGGTYRLFEALEGYGLKFTYTEMGDPGALIIRRETKLIWLESPTNPLLKVIDIAEVATRLRRMKDDALLVVDNTFATPYLQRPLELGADIVVYSTTKYLSGHCDVVGGAVVTPDEEVYQRLKFIQNAVGAVPSPFDCFLVMRGLRTLPVRMDRHCANARRVAEFLEEHPKVARVYYPGLAGHPGHETAAGQMRGFGGMVSFELDGDVRAFLRGLRLIALAESLGGVESLICHPATMTHAAIPEEERRHRGIGDNLLRISVGLESYPDLERDLAEALERA